MSIFSNQKDIIKDVDDVFWKGIFDELYSIIKCDGSVSYQWDAPKDFPFNTDDFQVDSITIIIYDKYPNIKSQEHMAHEFRSWKVTIHIYFKDDKVPSFNSRLQQGYNPDPELTEEQILKYMTIYIKSNFNKIIKAYSIYRENCTRICIDNYIESWVEL